MDKKRKDNISDYSINPFLKKDNERKKERWKIIVDQVLSDNLMIFLGISMVPVVLIPLIIPNVSQSIIDFLSATDTVIISIFVMEYFLKLYLSPDRTSHFLNRWHLIDLLIITLPLLEFLPVAGYAIFRISPILRVSRIFRVFAVGGRTYERRTSIKTITDEHLKKEVPKLQINGVIGELENKINNITLEELQTYIQDPDIEAWFDISNLSKEDISKLSAIFDISEVYFKSKLLRYSTPRIEFIEDEWLIFVKKPERSTFSLEGAVLPSISYMGIIIIYRPGKIITISKKQDNVFKDIYERTLKNQYLEDFLAIRVLYNLLDYINDSFDTILIDLEALTFNLQIIPSDQMPSNFLKMIFHLKREINIIASTLFHLTEALNIIKNKKVIHDSKKIKSMFTTIYDEADYFSENASNIHENIVNIIDLHVNTVSYGMNRAMKVIAVLTAVVIIPQVVGGLLGMNLIDVPWHALLWQVTALNFIAMFVVAYIFYKLGWF